jgi:16S rRNA (adenine1518-N6/adenine1519-N6)-dimethyltransferase
VQWIEGDVLAGKHALSDAVLHALPRDAPWHVVSNLPYAAGTPFMATAARLANPPRSMTCLVQLELARRIASAAGSSDWGPLAARIQLTYEASVGRSVPAHLFWPVPKVESAVLRLERRERLPEPAHARAFERLCETLFRHRRQSLGRVLTRGLGERERALELLARHGLDPGTRPEALGLAALESLAADPGWLEAASPERTDP